MGLAAFGTTIFTVSLFHVGIVVEAAPVVIPLSLFFGGLVQLLAGLVEFKSGSTFGATAFCSYGAYWLGYALYVAVVSTDIPASELHTANGIFDLPWVVLTLYLTVAATRTTGVLLTLFSFTTITLVVVCIANFIDSLTLLRWGGGFGLAAAGTAWYASFAGLVNVTWGRHLIPTFPDPGSRIAHLAQNKGRANSITSSAGERSDSPTSERKG
ncbi:acetate uptake transporter [Streptomyces parvulus]|uniref:acetate uptake transporter n=1 Tax=Streptomyces parvulus TaxID=146923 RepID=UPI0038056C36